MVLISTLVYGVLIYCKEELLSRGVGRSLDEDNELAFGSGGSDFGNDFGQSPPGEFLEFLGDFTREDNFPVAEMEGELLKGL